HAVAEQDGARALNPIMARLKRACLLNEDADAAKARALAREILNDWDAITAFVTNPDLPPTNNDAETALRHAVIARRISFGTRTEEGSRAWVVPPRSFARIAAAALSKPSFAASSMLTSAPSLISRPREIGQESGEALEGD